MCGAMDPLMRNLPITAADHEREREMQIKLGKVVTEKGKEKKR